MKINATFIKTRRVILTAAFIVIAGSFYSIAAQSPPHINVNARLASNNVARGRSVQASVVMDIPSGYHVNSNKPLEKFLIATQLKVEAPEGIRVGTVFYPRAVLRKFKFSKGNVSVFERRAIMRFNLAVPSNISGSKEVKLKVRYQSCNDEVCFPPQTKELNLWLNVQ
jgi:thiol:disulfide interchange protein DsbD